MHIEEHKSLKNYNTFGIDCKARYFAKITSLNELQELLKNKIHKPIFILGAGSNILLTHDINALVLHINIKGITVQSETDDSIILEVMAGENWHNFVLYCLDNNYGGIENLSLIPGNVGTAPIQNIGAYGVELKEVFVSCKTIEIETLNQKEFMKEDCQFGYRNSIFKNQEKGKHIITSVCLQFSKKNHRLRYNYGDIKKLIAEKNIKKPSIKDISEAVISIRKSKLPDPKIIGNSGSFFKNPIVNKDTFNKFIKQHPKAPYYKISENNFKIPAGWLIEQCGFKGKRFGDAGVHAKQALVLVNYGNAKGKDILNLALKIQNQVKAQFGINISPEVNLI